MGYVPPPAPLSFEEFVANGCRDPELEKWERDRERFDRAVRLLIGLACAAAVIGVGALYSGEVVKMLSTHKVEVVPVVLEPHPNADTLSIVRVWGYACCVRTEDWKDRAIGAYIPPDSVVPATPEFAFLDGHSRIKARKFRGVMSQGLLHPAPEGAQIGDDVAEALGVTHYEPPEVYELRTGGETESPPFHTSKYDIDSGYRYGHLMEDGEEVVATEKIHGANATFCYHNGRMWSKSHREWKKPESGAIWWKVQEQDPFIREWCEEHPDLCLCGEVFGQVQDLKYGSKPGQLFFRAFDVMRLDGTFLDYDEFAAIVPAGFRCPLVYRGPYSIEKMREVCDGKSLVPGADNLREGVVVGPVKERWDARLGRVKVKFVSPAYLERSR
jgi:RNA ligase (TIGR02306 family)